MRVGLLAVRLYQQGNFGGLRGLQGLGLEGFACFVVTNEGLGLGVFLRVAFVDGGGTILQFGQGSSLNPKP